MKRESEKKDKILVRGVNWVGDAVMTLPALHALRKAFPDAWISLLVKPSVAAIFESNPCLSEIIIYEERFRSIFGKIKLSWNLRKKGFTRAILLQNAFDAALIAFLSGIPEREGYDRDGRGRLLTKAVPYRYEDRSLHHIEYYLRLMDSLGIPPAGKDPWIYLSPEERFAARERLSGLSRPLLGINPGAAYGVTKQWLPERFARVANWFIQDTGGSVAIFGSRDEMHIARTLEGKIPEGRAVFAGKTTLRELTAMIAECDLFLTNDSGPLHVAYAVGTPVVAVFGSTSPALTGPPSAGNIVLQDASVCTPCFDRTCRHNDLRCLYALSADDAYFALKKVLPGKRAVFFDRDGVLCKDVHFLKKWDDFELLPGIEEIEKLRAMGYMLIGVSNQSGIGRGIIQEEFVHDVNNSFIKQHGFDDFYFCPHLPGDYCSCRKPEPGMLYRARYEHGIDLRKSYVIGDKTSDMLLARVVGSRGILVRTGQHQESEYADIIVPDMKEAVKIIAEEFREP